MLHAFGVTISAATPAPIGMKSRSLVPSSACADLAALLVYQVGADPDKLRPPSEMFTGFGQDRYTAGRYVVVPSSSWRIEYRAAISAIYSAGGEDSVRVVNGCLLPKLIQITDLTSKSLVMALSQDVVALTGSALQSVPSVSPRRIIPAPAPSTQGGGRTMGEKTADAEQQITQAPPSQTDVWLPPVDEPPPGGGGAPVGPEGACLASGGSWDPQTSTCSQPVFVPPTAEEKPFPWVPVLAGVAVVGGIGIFLLTKKKRK